MVRGSWSGSSSPILSVLKPKPISIPSALKLVQDDSSENGAGAVQRLQQPPREELQFGNVAAVQFLKVMEKLQERHSQRTLKQITWSQVLLPWFYLPSSYLRIGAAELWVDVSERGDGRQIQTFSDFGVTSQAKVSSSLDGHGHQVCASEPQRTVHEV